ncbi:MAG TPA: prepilin peptidase [Candidatus Limnocylindrales bacterium]|nr:prepilin peptidase [Candidatus Limnocylindrales bacterium]
MPELFVIVLFILGIFVGSFLNVLADRLPNGENPFKGRSHCEYCKKILSPFDLIPLFSYISTGGKCRYCKKKLSFYYPLSELITGILFASAYIFSTNIGEFNIHFWLTIAYSLVILSSLIVIFLTDIKYGLIPFNVTVMAFVVALIFKSIYFSSDLRLSFISALCSFLAFLFIFLVTKGRGMGFGDVIYVFLMGFLLGYPKIILGMYIAFISGAIISLILVMAKKKKIKGSTIPFGPFLVSGTIISMFWGDILISKITGYLLI